MTDSLRFDAGAGGNPYLACDDDPDMSATSSLYVTFRVVSAPADFDYRSLLCVGNSGINLYLSVWFGRLSVITDASGESLLPDVVLYGWLHFGVITSGGVSTVYVIEDGFDPGGPTYLMEEVVDCGGYDQSAVVGGRDFGFGVFQTNAGCHVYGHVIAYPGVAHSESEMLAQFQSRAAVHAGPHTELAFDSASTPGADQSGNGNDWTATNGDGIVAVADEPASWASGPPGPPPPAPPQPALFFAANF